MAASSSTSSTSTHTVYDVSGEYPDAATAALALCRKALLGQHLRITHCVSQLSEAQFWWRPRPDMNAIGNLLLHLRGNIGQWIIAGVGQRPFQRDRPAEFASGVTLSQDEVEAQLAATVTEAADVLAHYPPSALLEPRRVQGHDTTALGAMLHATSHFEGHAQEIISLTRQQLGANYRYLWVPSKPEQVSQGGSKEWQGAAQE